MSARIACPHCGVKLALPADAAGQTARCPECRKLMALPEAPPPVAPLLARAEDIPSKRRRDDYDEEDRPRKKRPQFRCPFCGSEEVPVVERKISTAGWIVFVVLLLCCFPLCLIALFITEDQRRCYDCGMRIGA